MNIAYQTGEIAEYFAQHRSRWAEFYPSEQLVFERILGTAAGIDVLDVGCAIGGLGAALAERFVIDTYVGVDINAQAITLAKARAWADLSVEFHTGDILSVTARLRQYQLVTNLSCADWNTETDAIIQTSWGHVAAGGHLVLSLRLTKDATVNDITRSYQPIGRSGDERANYVVMNVHDALGLLRSLEPRPSSLFAYGYWGTPSASATTPFDRLVFAVFSVGKRSGGARQTTMVEELRLPLDLTAQD